MTAPSLSQQVPSRRRHRDGGPVYLKRGLFISRLVDPRALRPYSLVGCRNQGAVGTWKMLAA